jgi:TetR/AcrR family transcriptional repressor of nem operon
LAQLVLSVMGGGVMQARTYRSLDAFDASVACLRDYFNRLEAGTARRSAPSRR